MNNRLDLLLRLKGAYPKLKVTLFTIPYDFEYEKEVTARIMREKTLEAIKKQLDWIELVPHGLLHLPNEFLNCDYITMRDYVFPSIDEAFKKDGLPYEKGFKAPQWLWNKEVVRALDEKGWWGAIDRADRGYAKTKKYYTYTHSISEVFSLSTLDVLKLHGHITNIETNGIERCFTNLFKMPTNAKFKFASEMLQE
jgi:hypothetical protein